jgi:hypothetical protein
LTKINKNKTQKGFILKVRWATPQASAMHRLVSFWNVQSRAGISLFMVSCCLLLGKGTGVLDGDLAQ